MDKTVLIAASILTALSTFSQSQQAGSGRSLPADLGPAPEKLSIPYTEEGKKNSGDLFYFNSNALAFNGGAGTIPVSPFSFKLNNPTKYTSLNNPTASGEFMLGATYANGKWYALRYPDNKLITVDTSTGVRTDIGVSTPNGSEIWAGLTYDEANNTMYAVSTSGSAASSTLYTVNMNTGTVTTVGTAPGVSLICLAANKSGNLYSVDISADNFGSINKSTGAFSVIGPIGFDARFAQDMEFDFSTDTCFYACYNNTAMAAEIRTVDITTGNTTLIGTFPASSQILGFAIPAGHVVGIRNQDEDSMINAVVYPNPFSEHAEITFSLLNNEHVTINLSDVCGKKMNILADEVYSPGDHSIRLDASGLKPGVYFCSIRAGNSSHTLKILLTR